MLGTETWLPEHSHVYAKHQTILVEEIAVDPLINDRDWNNQHSFLLLPILLCREGTSKQGPPIPWPQLSQALHCKCVLVMLFSWLGQGARACLGLCTHARRLMQWWQWQWTPIQLAGEIEETERRCRCERQQILVTEFADKSGAEKVFMGSWLLGRKAAFCGRCAFLIMDVSYDVGAWPSLVCCACWRVPWEGLRSRSTKSDTRQSGRVEDITAPCSGNFIDKSCSYIRKKHMKFGCLAV
jgi:hypothetical protein